MKIVITNAAEADMPAEMQSHCEQLLLQRIAALPAIGDELTVLYSENDPLGEAGEVDDSAYFVYFGVTDIECPDLANPANASISVELLY